MVQGPRGIRKPLNFRNFLKSKGVGEIFPTVIRVGPVRTDWPTTTSQRRVKSVKSFEAYYVMHYYDFPEKSEVNQ